MRILHLDTGREMRGGQHQALMLMRLQRNAGHRVRLLAAADSPLLELAQQEDFEAGWIAWPAVRICSRQTDVVHCHDARSHTLAAMWSSAPVVVSRRVAFSVNNGILSRWKYRKAAKYLAVSKHVGRLLVDAGIPEAKVAIVPDAVELPPKASDFTGGAVAIGSDDPGKGVALLREAGVPIVFSRDLHHDLQHARVFAYASTMEGLGSAALLAMSYGVPVVASRVGGLPEAVDDGVTGLVVDNTAAAFRNAIRHLLENEPLARQMGHAGRNRVAAHFSPQRMLEDTLSAYNQVIA